MRDQDRLRGQAAKARRLAGGVSDSQTRLALTAYADEIEALADAVDTTDAEGGDARGRLSDDEGGAVS